MTPSPLPLLPPLQGFSHVDLSASYQTLSRELSYSLDQCFLKSGFFFFLHPVSASASASAGSMSEIQGPSPQARLIASEYLGDGAPKPACLTGLPGHSDTPQGLRTIKAVGPQNSSTLTLLRLVRSGFLEEGSLESDGGDLEWSYKGVLLRAWRQRHGDRKGVCRAKEQFLPPGVWGPHWGDE